MGVTVRKYPTQFKTTTSEGCREYHRLLMRDRRREKKDGYSRMQVRLAFLEFEVVRLSRALDVALSRLQ